MNNRSPVPNEAPPRMQPDDMTVAMDGRARVVRFTKMPPLAIAPITIEVPFHAIKMAAGAIQQLEAQQETAGLLLFLADKQQ